MPSFNDAKTTDAYQGSGPGLPTIEGILPLPNGGGRFNVEAAGGAVLCQVQYGAQGAVEWAENEEQLLNPGAYGTIPDNACGIRFRSAKTGVPGVVSASMGTDPSRPALTIDALGAISTVIPSGVLLYNVHDYGALGDGMTDDTAAIQLAIDTAHKAGGGIVFFPIPAGGAYVVNGTLALTDYENIELVGAEASNNQYAAPTGVILLRTAGTGTMLAWTMVLAGTSLRGWAIRNLVFDCNGLADTGLLLGDLYGGLLDNVMVWAPTVVAIDIFPGGAAGSLGFQRNTVSRVTTRCVDVGSTNAIAMRWRSAGPGSSNVSINLFENILLYHENGVGLDAGDSDSNIVVQLAAGNGGGGGTAEGILLRGSNSVAGGHCRDNHFYGCQPTTGVTAQATGLVTPSEKNVFFVNEGNTVPPPTVEPGAQLTWIDFNANFGLDLSLGAFNTGAILLPNNVGLYALSNVGAAIRLLELTAANHAHMDAILEVDSLQELFTTRNQNVTATLTPNMGLESYFQVFFNGAGGVVFTFAAPLNGVDSNHTQRLTIDINNFSGNALSLVWDGGVGGYLSGNVHFLPGSVGAGLDWIGEFRWVGGVVNRWQLMNVS